MTKKIDKDFVKALGRDLLIDLSDEEIKFFIPFIQEIEDSIPKYLEGIKDIKLDPTYFPKTANCASLRKDEPVNGKEDYLANAKKADKYVVGK